MTDMVAVLMLPAMLYLMRLARKGSPRLAVSGGVLAFVRWLAGFRACPGHRGGGCSFVLATAKLPAMTSESRHISEWIDRPADEVYDYASDPANLPHWAPGLGSSVENVDERWFVESSMGRVAFAFAPHNEYGILDHDVTLPSGEIVYNPMRVIRAGSGSEVVFTLRRLPNVTDEDFAGDAEAVAADLTKLKGLLERGLTDARSSQRQR